MTDFISRAIERGGKIPLICRDCGKDGRIISKKSSKILRDWTYNFAEDNPFGYYLCPKCSKKRK